MLYPVWSLQGRVGEIRWEQVGLYRTYHAELSETLNGFVHLYLHMGEICHSLGVFRPENGVLTLNGRISARSIGNPGEHFAFSILTLPYLPPEAQKLPAPLPFCARSISNGWEYCIPADGVDERGLPYFCFFRPAVIDNRSCVLLTQDREGRPYLPNVSP